MRPFHRASFLSSYSNSTTVTYTFYNDQTTLPSQPNSTPVPVESSEAPIPITVHLPQQQAQAQPNPAAKIQSAYRAHRIRTLYRTISSVNSDANELQRLIQRQETVDAVRSDEREKLRMNEALMGLLLKLDSVPGWDPAIREARRKVSRRIVGLQEILDAITEAKVLEDGGFLRNGEYYGWGYDGFMRNWDEVVAEMEEEVCRAHGGDELERFCAQNLGFRCLQRFLREP